MFGVPTLPSGGERVGRGSTRRFASICQPRRVDTRPAKTLLGRFMRYRVVAPPFLTLSALQLHPYHIRHTFVT